MNLAFEMKGGLLLDFPIQTPTQLSRAVMGCKDHTARLKLIEDWLTTTCQWKKQVVAEMMVKIRKMMTNKALHLVIV